MTEDQLFEIACIIDNEYRSKRKTFKATKNRSCWSLTTGVCDSAYLIRIWEKDDKISSIYVLGEDTDNYRLITVATRLKIEKYLESLNTKTTI